MMTRVEFKLSMPGRASWNGGWSGADRNYTLVRKVANPIAAKLNGRLWSYAWPDGWCAGVHARVIPPGERLKKSDGFNGYGWMIESILQYGKIYADHERPEAVTP